MTRNALPLLRSRPVRWLAWAFVALLSVLVVYGVAGLIGGALPANSWRTVPQHGVRIYVEDNGIHTGIVVPVDAAGMDWRDLVHADDIADPRYARYGYLAFGWGDRHFYEDTPNWSDISLITVLHAAMGSDDTVLHVEHIPEPIPDSSVRSIMLRVDEYRRLAAFIRASFALTPDGRTVSVRGYGPYDAFYSATGKYDSFTTCNSWTGRALRNAGVPMGRWTPFSGSVMAWL
ncbi:uncharacterized protein (TIGR02117 family) [Stakelama sediminis]|uniref:Uncharacterized protein (TIGR02117 family) n=1 Tax=Stakelama sediminis TaxID=463200 RepID=A0A840Z1F9_9SPHN|nr:TIGR02117 family protein [Stakelama sediminis]MBB5719574.1 uncharacterized protein (TIGR02117 family) [Stakelama sediminis]